MGRRFLLVALLLAVGLVWIAQGTGLLRGSSFMVGDPRWAIAGAMLVVVGLVALVSARRRP
jgi:hypothetical protein